MFVTPAYAQGTGAAGGLDIIIQVIPFVLIFVIMYFLLIRPQQKRMKEHKAMIAAVRRGDQVVTAGGFIGKVKTVHDPEEEVTVELSKGVEVRMLRASISEVRNRTEPLRETSKAAE